MQPKAFLIIFYQEKKQKFNCFDSSLKKVQHNPSGNFGILNFLIRIFMFFKNNADASY